MNQPKDPKEPLEWADTSDNPTNTGYYNKDWDEVRNVPGRFPKDDEDVLDDGSDEWDLQDGEFYD